MEQFRLYPGDDVNLEKQIDRKYDNNNGRKQIRTTTTEEIIRELSMKKTSGWDQITNRMIKELPEGYIDCRLKKTIQRHTREPTIS